MKRSVNWDYSLSEKAVRDLKKLDSQSRCRIVDFLDTRIRNTENPRQTGKALRGPLGEFWRYRVGDFRVLCQIQDDRLIVLVVRVGNRKDVYD